MTRSRPITDIIAELSSDLAAAKKNAKSSEAWVFERDRLQGLTDSLKNLINEGHKNLTSGELATLKNLHAVSYWMDVRIAAATKQLAIRDRILALTRACDQLSSLKANGETAAAVVEKLADVASRVRRCRSGS